MVKKTASEIAEKWQRKAEGATEDYKSGINRVIESPMEKAIAKKDKMRTNLIKALDEGKWEKGLKAVSTQEWKDAAIVKGAANYATGVRASKGKMEEFMGEFIPHLETGQKIVEDMPDITLEDNIKRAEAMMRHNAKFKRKKFQ